MTRYRVRGTQADSVRFEFDLEADDPWHAVARSVRLIDVPETVTSISVMPIGPERR